MSAAHSIKTNAQPELTANREAVIDHYELIIVTLRAQLADMRAQLADARKQRAAWHVTFGSRLTKLCKPRPPERTTKRPDQTRAVGVVTTHSSSARQARACCRASARGRRVASA
jgi:hypothetical protein